METDFINSLLLNSIKERVFFEKKYRKKALVPS